MTASHIVDQGGPKKRTSSVCWKQVASLKEKKDGHHEFRKMITSIIFANTLIVKQLQHGEENTCSKHP